jgi:NADPH:quinone reductase
MTKFPSSCIVVNCGAPQSSHGEPFLTRPSLAHYVLTREETAWRAGAVLDAVRTGALKLRLHGTRPLSQAADAHRLLEGRETTGKIVLTMADEVV